MKKRTILVGTALVLASTTGLLFAPVSSSAQTDPQPTNPNILAAVQQVQATLNGLVSGLQTFASSVQTALTNIQNSLTNLQPAPVGNVLNTTILDFVPGSTQSGEFRCRVTNVAAANRTVVIEFVEESGVVHTTFAPALLTPGKSTFGGLAANNQFFNPFRCRFTVQDGTKQDVIGALVLTTVIFSGSTATTATVSVDAR